MNELKGIEYPIKKHIKGFFHSTDFLKQIKSNLATIILTSPGERLFDPYFGTLLDKVNLNAPLEMAQADAKMKIALSIKKWEKRVQVDDIIVDFAKIDDGNLILKIQVFFINPIDINNMHDLILYKSLGQKSMPF